MPTIIAKSPNLAENLDIGISGAIVWDQPNRALTSNGLSSSATNTGGETISDYLYVRDFQFDIPTGAVQIKGITVRVHRQCVGLVQDNIVALAYLSGTDLVTTIPGKQKVGNWSTSSVIESYGSQTDFWNRQWTKAELNSEQFGVVISTKNLSANSSALIDYIEVEISYNRIYGTVVSGGLTGSGEANSKFTYRPRISGGSRASGHGSLIFDIEGTGGVTANGLSVNSHTLYGSGGITLGADTEFLLVHEEQPNYWFLNLNIDESTNPIPTSNVCTAKFGITTNGATNTLHWIIEHNIELDIDIVAIGIRGPAKYGQNGPSKIPIGVISGKTSPIVGSRVLSNTEFAELKAGLWYIRLLDVFGSELRSQIYNSTGSIATGTIIPNIISDPVATGGLSLGGEAQEDFVFPGIFLRGSADVTNVFNPLVEGSISVSGDSFVDPYIATGGSFASGTSDVTSTFDPFIDNFGSKSGGQSFVNYAVAIGGGVIIDGQGLKLSDPVIITGQVLLGGTAGVFPYFSEGGSTIGGDAKVTPYFENGTGGIKVGNINIDLSSIVNADSIKFSVVLRPSKVVPPQVNIGFGVADFYYNETTNQLSWKIQHNLFQPQTISLRGPSGTDENGSLRVALNQFSTNGANHPALGATILTSAQEAWLLTGKLYVEITDAVGNQVRSQVDRYGISLGGSSVISDTVPIGNEGVSIGGSAKLSKRSRHNPTGGIVCSGDHLQFIAFVPSGGISLGGDSFDQKITDVSVVGGIDIDGTVDVDILYTIISSGDIIGGGRAISGITPIIGGGITSTGESGILFSYIPRSIGGASVRPFHRQTFIDYIIGDGGLILLPKSSVGRVKFIIKQKSYNSALAMNSNNIVKDAANLAREKEKLITPSGALSPKLDENRFRIQHNPTWCEPKENCNEGAIVSNVIKQRQGKYMPPKVRDKTNRDRGFANYQ